VTPFEFMEKLYGS